MQLFNTTLTAMKQSQAQQSTPWQNSLSSALEEALSNITEITRLQAEATHTATEKSRQSREEKGKLSTVAYHDLYDDATNDVIVNTTSETKAPSNHFYSSLCSCLYGEAFNMMDTKTAEYCGKGVEFLRAMIPVYHPQ
eukprot:14681047-Ditylum_brightwellii.AAC.2